MAIFFPIKCIERHEALVVLEFSAARKGDYVTQGQVYVDLITQEIELVETYTSEAENIFIPVKGAIKRELQNGKIPDEFAYAA